MMERYQNITLFALRLSLGWLFFYAGITKILDPAWTAEGYLRSAKTFSSLYAWLAQPGVLPLIDGLNEWGLALLGLSLILGFFVGISALLGAFMMLLYYFPVLEFPYVGHGYLVDEHIVYALALLCLAASNAGRVWGLDAWCANLPLCRKYPVLRQFFG